MKIVFLDRETFAPSVELTRPATPHAWEEHLRTAPDQVAARLVGATVAITNKVPLRRATLETLPDLKFISVAATGYDCVDIDACRDLGIAVSNVRGYAETTVPEHVFALILGLSRSMAGYRQAVIEGRWQQAGQFCFHDFPIRDLGGATIGIVGAGVIGGKVARLAEAFGMIPLLSARKGETPGEGRVSFDEMIERADVITVHCPLTPATRGMIAAPEFARMTRRPIIINAGRGGLIDEADAAAALEAGRISGLGFDVLTAEPPADDNPILKIAHRPDVLLTPHVAWASQDAMEEVWRQTVGAVDAFATGRPERLLT